jgi:hypothetical protein
VKTPKAKPILESFGSRTVVVRFPDGSRYSFESDDKIRNLLDAQNSGPRILRYVLTSLSKEGKKLPNPSSEKTRTMIAPNGDKFKVERWLMMSNKWEYYIIKRASNTDDIKYALIIGIGVEFENVYIPEIEEHIKVFAESDALWNVLPPPSFKWEDEKKRKKPNPETKKTEWLRLNYNDLIVDITSDQLIKARKLVRGELKTNPEIEVVIQSIMDAIMETIKKLPQLSSEEMDKLAGDVALMALFEEAIDGTPLNITPILAGDVGTLERKLKLIKH